MSQENDIQEVSRLFQPRVMVVDHRGDRRSNLLQLLAERDVATLEADNCEMALELLASQPVHLILTETELPNKSGLYLLQKVKEQHPDTEVILITHNASSYNLLRALRNGAYDFIVRPIDTGEILYNALERVFGHIHLRQQNSQLLDELARHNSSLTRSLKMLKALNASIERVAAAVGIETLFKELLISAMDELQAQRAFLGLFDREGERIGLKAGAGIPNAVCREYAGSIPQGLTTEIARRGKPILVPGELPASLVRMADVAELEDLLTSRGLLAAPLRLKGRVVGIVVLSGSPPEHPFSEHELHFLIQLSHHAALALEKAGVIHLLRRNQTNHNNHG